MTPPAPGKYLNTLAFRCTPALVADAAVYIRHLDEETWKLWDDLDRQCKQRYRNDSAQAPYSIATLVLGILSGGYVHFAPDRRAPFLASREPLDSRILRRVFTLTHGLALGDKIDAIDLTTPPELAKRIADLREEHYLLADHLTPTPGRQPNSPGWVYRTVTWDLARRLAAKPWAISDSKEITLQPDTTGGLIALDDPWVNDQGGRFALSRTRLALKTLPNITSPLLLLTSRVTHIADSLIFSKTALAKQPGIGRPVLELDLDGRGGARTVNRLALDALGRLDMDYSILRTMAERSTREQQLLAQARAENRPARFPRDSPGQVWPVRAKSASFPIGVGTGMHHLRRLRDHASLVFADAAEPLELLEVRMQFPHRPTDPERISARERARRKEERASNGRSGPLAEPGNAFPSPEAIVASVKAAGFDTLRIACLWYRDETRLRMLDTLRRVFALDHVALDPQDDQELELHPGTISAVFQQAGEFLRPGRAAGREEALRKDRFALESRDGVLIGAWCETEMPTAEDATDTDAGDLDAKHQTRSILAALGVPTQYLLGSDDNGVIHPKEGKDHPAEWALLDLYRSLGIIDDRIANALKPPSTGYPVDRVAHVGIHVRQQNRRKGERGRPKVVITASALVPPADPVGTWTLIGWSSTRPEWQPYRAAQTAFHATSYPEGTDTRTYRQRWDEAADIVERALQDLANELDGIPYAVTVDEMASRRMWHGLQNIHQGASAETRTSRYWLPGSTLHRDDRPQAVIRVNIKDDEVPSPVSTTRVSKDLDSQPTDGETATTLYQVTTDFGTPVWILCNVPRSYDGAGAGRLGAKYTRWDARRSVWSDNKAERRKGEMSQNWYSMTATEIYPLTYKDTVPADALAIATAKLCHQTISWSDRIRHPVPLHAAKQMDLDHPQYRRTVQTDGKEPTSPADA
ncbi:RNaseH domain-containing protein [Frankia sp. ACN1ag]|uniref:RNaseH domain-containing protein n=1 Tax=Frankia sp. ACN1ag TaxID=102891 RepID=UPI000A746741|nr:RNaseH domain-containing protein [Frankia sp. ACN1ag]